SIRDPYEMVTKHILDSLVVAPYLQGKKFIDVGTGAGLPGIPLAILQPQLQFTLLDSLGKRIRFLTQVKQAINLPNVTLVQNRVQDYQQQQFDGILSRVFSCLADMLLWCKHLATNNGYFYALKGVYPAEELAQIAADYHYQVV